MKRAGLAFLSLLACWHLVPAVANENSRKPTIILGSGVADSRSLNPIPVTFENHDELVGLQFDVTFDPSLFADVDTSQCLEQLQKRGYLAACRRQDPPNHDVVRFVIFNLGLEPIQSGQLGSLGFQAASNAPTTESPLSALECTGLGVTRDQATVSFSTGDIEAGSITVLGDGQKASSATGLVLDLGGAAIPHDSTVFRSMREIQNPAAVLETGTKDVVLVFPDGREQNVIRKRFTPRHGYVARLDCSGDQVPDDDPGTPLSFRWYGELADGGWLGLTVERDVARGTLVTREGSYKILGAPEKGFRLAEVDLAGLPPSDAEIFASGKKASGDNSTGRLQIDAEPGVEDAGEVELDMLIMYTAQAQIDAGGPAGLNALIQEALDNTNQAFANSGMPNLTVREVHREMLAGFVPSGTSVEDAQADLDGLRVNSQILAAREAHHADVTSVLLRDVVNNQGMEELGFCGIAYLQSPTCGIPGEFPECGVGVDFEDFAINWVSVQCATLPGRNAFPHELGHLMGAEHQPGADSQDPADASFDWSFAHFSLSGAPFGTLMWVPTGQTGELPQPLNFSNPDVLIQAQPSGIENQRDNIRTFEILAPIMDQFRVPPPELIFKDGFE